MKKSFTASSLPKGRQRYEKLCKASTDKPSCGYLHRYCTRPRLDGFLYCINHILQDKNAPFQQCSFLKNRKRCFNVVPKNDSLCSLHIKKPASASSRVEVSPKKENPPKKFRSLVAETERYCEMKGHDPHYDAEKDIAGRLNLPVKSSVPVDIRFVGSAVEGERARVNESWLGLSEESESDLDESDRDDALQHAGVYTYEEVARIYRDKLIHLQNLYLEQFKWLFYDLRESRRDYLHTLKNERRTQGSISEGALTGKDEATYKELKGLRHYHRPAGQEAVLHHKYMQKRKRFLEGKEEVQPVRDRCVFSSDGTQCSKEPVVLSKYCWDHIMSDPQQVMFRHCPGGDGSCQKPVVPYTDDVTCLVHSRCKPSSPVSRHLKKYTEDMGIPSSSYGSSGLPSECHDALNQEPELFQSMVDIASLSLDVVDPGSLFGLNQFGEPGESTDSALSGDNGTYMSVSASEMLCHPQVSDSESD